MTAAGSNRLVRADAIDLARLAGSGNAELAYLDPPFSVGVDFGARTKNSQERARGAPRSGPVAYTDKWRDLDAYLAWLAPRVRAAKQALSPRGTLWLHLDHRAVHEAKVLCDEIFGRGAFLGEIIWLPGNGSKARRGPGTTHQTLLLYAAGDDFVWNRRDPALREPYAATSLSMHFTHKDRDGRAYRLRVVRGKSYKYYADEGRALGSVWSDCPAMSANTPLMRETTGYPTQKPLKLLDRIVRASTSPGALVVDPFSGSGTTLVAAARLGRRFLGCDVGELAIETASRRLRDAGIAFQCDDARAGPLSRHAP